MKKMLKTLAIAGFRTSASCRGCVAAEGQKDAEGHFLFL